MALRILANTVSVPILDIRRQFAPVVRHLVGVAPEPRFGFLDPGFIHCPEYKGGAAANGHNKLRRVLICQNSVFPTLSLTTLDFPSTDLEVGVSEEPRNLRASGFLIAGRFAQ